jgi:hypothetical protein
MFTSYFLFLREREEKKITKISQCIHHINKTCQTEALQKTLQPCIIYIGMNVLRNENKYFICKKKFLSFFCCEDRFHSLIEFVPERRKCSNELNIFPV